MREPGFSEDFFRGGFINTQDAFDHDKGQKFAISGRRLHWIFFILLLWIISLFSRFSMQCSKESSTQDVEKLSR